MRNMIRELKYGASTVVYRAKANPGAAVAAGLIDLSIGILGAFLFYLAIGGGSC